MHMLQSSSPYHPAVELSHQYQKLQVIQIATAQCNSQQHTVAVDGQQQAQIRLPASSSSSRHDRTSSICRVVYNKIRPQALLLLLSKSLAANGVAVCNHNDKDEGKMPCMRIHHEPRQIHTMIDSKTSAAVPQTQCQNPPTVSADNTISNTCYCATTCIPAGKLACACCGRLINLVAVGKLPPRHDAALHFEVSIACMQWPYICSNFSHGNARHACPAKASLQLPNAQPCKNSNSSPSIASAEHPDSTTQRSSTASCNLLIR